MQHPVRRAAALLSLALLAAAPAWSRQLMHGPRAGPGSTPQGISPDLNQASSPVIPPHLDYCGGPVLSQAQLVAVLWGPPLDPVPPSATCTGTFKHCLETWYADFVASPQFDWLDEYQTTLAAAGGTPGTNQHILHPTFYGAVQITPSNTKAVVSEAEVEAEIVAQIQAGKLPAPGAADETLYEVHFPLTVDPSESGMQACSDFCAYHDSWHSSILGTNGIIAILPSHMPPGYSGGRDCSGCGEKSDWFANLGGSISHETIEAITDPLVGLSTGACAPPLGWYDSNNADGLSPHGEIGDMCEGIPHVSYADQVTEVTTQDANGFGYTVQREWSNQLGACIVSAAAAFSISASDASLLVDVGGSSTTTITSTAPSNGNTALPIKLAARGVPTGATVTFQPATLSAGGTSTMTVALAATATQTGFGLGITAESGEAQAQTVVQITAPEFNSSLSGSSLALTAGGAPATFGLSTSVTTGPARGYTLKTGGIHGVTVTPSSGQLGTDAALSFSAAAGAPSATGALIFSITSAGITHALPIQTTIRGDDATLAVPANLTVAQGGSTSFTVTSATTAGNPQTLALSATGLAEGLTVTFIPPSITSGQTAKATVSASSAVPRTALSFSISGQGPVAAVTVAVPMTVVAPSGCASPDGLVFGLLGLVALSLRKRARGG